MYDSIIRTKLIPSRPSKFSHPRSRLIRRLLEARDYRLTIIQAGPGYGKSTALAALADAGERVAWYHLDADDNDTLVFLAHLIHCFAQVRPEFSAAPLARLEEWDRNGRVAPWKPVIDSLINELSQSNGQPLFLILDDAHHLDKSPQLLQILDRFISRSPVDVHIILAARFPVRLPNLITWRVRGELLEIDQNELAFTNNEIDSMFSQFYAIDLSDEQIAELVVRTEGWAIALQLVGQRLQRGGDTTLPEAMAGLSGSDLFAYLTREVLAQQPPDVQEFLRVTAVLRQMSPTLCDCLRQSNNSQQLLRYLVENDLFVVTLGDGHIRYHHLFRDFLRHQTTQEEIQQAHGLVALCCYSQLLYEDSVHHWFAAGNLNAAAELLSQFGREMVRSGRLETLAHWLGSLPPDILENYPALLAYLGDIARLHSRFDEALAWYQQAERRGRDMGNGRIISQALRGQARVYLDTVNPSQAEQLLQEALRLSDGEEDRESRARLLDLLAENLLNLGRADAAAAYQNQARELRDQAAGTAEYAIRVLLRTGRLAEARRLLQQQAAIEAEAPVQRPRMHRDPNLLLSLILAFQGEAAETRHHAIAGTERGKALNSPFTTAVGYMRQGHAYLLQKDNTGYDHARLHFEEAIHISKTIDVPRLRVEALWGLCQAYGFRGDMEMARQVAQQGIDLAQAAGDEWVAACIRVTLGAGLTLAHTPEEATGWLAQAATAFRECGDTHGETITRLWQCLVWQQLGDETRLQRDVDELLRLARQYSYDFLFLQKTLLGPPEPRSLIPLLLLAQQKGQQHVYARRLLDQLGLDRRLQFHPGYQMRIQTLGTFRLWRGEEEVDAGEWQRKKARQLFLLLLTFRHTRLHRDQITEILWPDLTPEGAQRDFKIAFNTLTKVLEPNRPRNAPSAFVLRDGSRYGLRPEADIWLDVDEFTTLVGQGNDQLAMDPMKAWALFQQALSLYRGEYLQEYPYEEWCSEERERLLTSYLQTAEQVATALLAQNAWENAVEVARSILMRDDCWEQAYRILMTAYEQMGNRSQALRIYQRCQERLGNELGVPPSLATIQLYESLVEASGKVG
ncbi:MAG: transcriptional regulator [Ardenticatenaceae bacterium]|nr:transcriptional regulator [Ardenticatenaceae bacterium]